MDSRPEWVPEWLWAVYTDAQEWNRAHPPHDVEFDARISERINSIIASRDCESLWRAMGARHQQRDAHLRASGFPLNRLIYWAILSEIAMNAEGIDPADAFTASARRRQGTTIANAVNNLRAALSEIVVGETLPSEFVYAATHYAQNKTSVFVANHFQDTIQIVVSPDGAHLHALSWAMGITYALTNPDAFSAITDGATKWAASRPPVARPGDANARRLYFIRQTTALMRHHYATPLREQVAALTRVLFDCDMDAATVAKLAP